MRASALAPAPPGWPADAIEVGRIVDGWGLKGWFKVQPYSTDPQTLLTCRHWHLQGPERALPSVALGAMAWPAYLEIKAVRAHSDGLVASAQGIADRTGADRLSGARIFVPRSGFPPVRAGEFYWADLIGLDVVNRDGDDLGTVSGLVETGPQTVLRLRLREGGDDAEERLVPFVAAYVDAVDLAARRIVVDWALDY